VPFPNDLFNLWTTELLYQGIGQTIVLASPLPYKYWKLNLAL